MIKALIVAAMAGIAYSECPNACSGHGSCGTFDVSRLWAFSKRLCGFNI